MIPLPASLIGPRIALFVGALATLTHASAAGQTRLPPNFGVTRWTTDDGLPSHYIPEIVQTSDGYIWMTPGGAFVRFDGVDFTEIDPAPPNPIGYVRGIGAGIGDTVWLVGATDRVVAYAGGRFLPGDSVGDAHTVVPGADGRLWVASSTQVWLREDAGFRSVFRHPAPLPGLNQGRYMWADGRGVPWIIGGPGQQAWRLEELDAPRTTLAVGTLVPDPSRGRALLSTGDDDTLRVREEGGPPLFRVPRDGRIPRRVDSRGRLWVTVEGALEVYPPNGATPIRIDLGASDVWVHQVLEDAGGSFWAATDQHGLLRVQERPFRVLRTQPESRESQMRTIGPGVGGTVLAPDLAGSLTRLGGPRPEVVLPTGSGAYAALEDGRGTLWFGASTPPQGLWGRTGDGEVVQAPISPPPQEIVEDPYRTGRLWLINGYLARIDPYRDSVPEIVIEREWRVRDIAFAGPDDLWAAGASGLVHLGPHGRRDYPAEDGYPVDIARSVFVDPATGDVWIGTYQTGLARLREGSFRTVRARDGLYEDVVSEILADDLGNLWMAGNRSVHRARLDELNAFLDGRADRVTGVGYGRESGLLNPETSGFAGHRDPHGRLWFPTFDGAAVVDPEEALRMDAYPPRLVLDEASLGRQRLVPGAAQRLRPNQRRLDVRYGAIFFRDPERVRFQVWLEGADTGWRDVGTTRELSYSSLGPGDYVLHLRAMSAYGAVSAENTTLAFTVPPYFHETIWFPLTGLLALLGLVAAAWRTRIRTLQAREALLSKLVDERTAELAEEQRRTKEQAEHIGELNQTRSRFFANLSHELRTPLTLIMGPLQDFVGGATHKAGDAKRALRGALDSSRRLDRLVDQLLDVARVESGRVKLRLRTVDGCVLLARLAESFEHLAAARSTRFVVRLPDDVAPITVDTDQADTIFSNLLDNAFKYTPEGGTVTLGAAVRDGDGGRDLVAWVEDDGRGIPGEDVGKVFERFHRAPERTERGAGLGLSLTKDLVEMQGGMIEVDSQEGRGSRFTVRLPLASTPSSGLAELPHLPRHGSDAWTEARPDGAASRSDDVDLDEDRPTVLLVEDHAELRAWMSSHLSAVYRVVEAGDGAQGLAEARRLVPDVIVSDIMMPGMDGDDLCRAVKHDPELSFVPVVLVTARGSREYRLSSLAGGADDYVVKPFDIEELLLRIRNIVESRRRLRERYERQSLRLPVLTSGPPPFHATEGEELEAQLRRVIVERLEDEDFGVNELAKAVAMSRSALYRKVESALGRSPMEMVWDVRLEQAALWLRDTEATVAEIAYGVGFKSVPHFCKRFREAYDQTPTEHRRSHAA